MAKNKKKNISSRLKKQDRLRQEQIVLALVLPIPSTPTPSSSSGSSPTKSSHSHGRFGPCHGYEDSGEKEDDSGSKMCKEDEAHAYKFFFSSPMLSKVLEDGLVIHGSHAHPISQ
ncbi:hypothetical protein OIU84_010463 [Salix udensis]|uniref:Uncharacterized protein n=1 Tax=Salix udensis TaxID=889485 RepID=A0AAD6JLG1_9ROSI|nr:hypothetical protein OIU84_010463 [Salix udensis]